MQQPSSEFSAIARMSEEYQKLIPSLEGFKNCMENLLKRLLSRKGIKPHTVSARVKTPESLRAKIERPDKFYTHLSEITDLLGVRVITHLAGEVDKVAALIRDEFDIDVDNSIDKRDSAVPERFGYVSLHIVCGLAGNRIQMPEYMEYKGLVCEVQIRTILQHAWAEIEHDLGYKTITGVPHPARRRFSRLAALLELADDEFARLASELSRYEEKAMQEVEKGEEHIPIDTITLKYFVHRNSKIKQIEASLRGGSIGREASSAYMERRVEDLHAVGVTDLTKLESEISKYSDELIRLTKAYSSEIAHMEGFIVAMLPMLYGMLKPTHQETCDFLAGLPRFRTDKPSDAMLGMVDKIAAEGRVALRREEEGKQSTDK